MNNKNDNLTVENENLLQIDEIKTNTNTETTINTNKPNGPPPLFNQVTRSDLLLFKEDFLRSMRELKIEINKCGMQNTECRMRNWGEAQQRIAIFRIHHS